MENMSAKALGKSSASDSQGASNRSFRLGRNDTAGEDLGGPTPDVSNESGAPSSAAAPPERYVNVLESGEKVFRWPAEKGPKLQALDISSGELTGRFPEGSDLSFRVKVCNASGGAVACRYQITILGLDNRRITRLLSPVDFFSGVPETRIATLQLKPCLLQAGEYYVNFAILTDTAMLAGVPTRRYDLVSRFADFEITRTLDYRERCVFTHPAEWTALALDDKTGS